MTLTTWTPPEEPNPREILYEACADTRAGAFKQALEKFIWFHRERASIRS